MKSKFKLYFLLFISCILLCSSRLKASEQSISASDIKKYTNDLLLLQNQIFSLAQYAVFPSSTTNSFEVQNSFNTLNTSLDTISKNIYTDLSKQPSQAPYANSLRLLLNTANYMYNSLYELHTILNTTDSTNKMLILERYFSFRIAAMNTLQLLPASLPIP